MSWLGYSQSAMVKHYYRVDHNETARQMSDPMTLILCSSPELQHRVEVKVHGQETIEMEEADQIGEFWASICHS